MTDHTDRLAWIASLERGWLDGSGEPVDWAVLGEAQRALAALPADEAPHWGIFPTEAGGILLEHSDVARSLGTITSVEIQPSGGAHVHCLGLAGAGAGVARLTSEGWNETAASAIAVALAARSLISGRLTGVQ